jgi:phosphoglucosamine mutase
LRGLRIVVDCAHGAGYHVAPPVFHELGADVIASASRPTASTSTPASARRHPSFCRTVRAHHADLGIALDGDGDRLIMVDSDGTIYDGDQLLYVIAADYHRRGAALRGVVGTLDEQSRVRAGAGARRHTAGARARRRPLCPRANARARLVLGGENSGHVICLDKHTTGDAIIAALAVLRALIEQRKTLAEATAGVDDVPATAHQRAGDARMGLAGERSGTHGGASGCRFAGRRWARTAASVGHRTGAAVMVEARERGLADRHAEALAQAIVAAAYGVVRNRQSSGASVAPSVRDAAGCLRARWGSRRACTRLGNLLKHSGCKAPKARRV